MCSKVWSRTYELTLFCLTGRAHIVYVQTFYEDQNAFWLSKVHEETVTEKDCDNIQIKQTLQSCDIKYFNKIAF